MIYVIKGAPRTKKTSNRIVRAGAFHKVLPSAAFKTYEASAVPQLQVQQHHLGAATHATPVHVRATFYREALRGDWTGYVQALADIMEAAGIVENDKLIAHWDGTRLDKDAANPRVEFEVIPCPL